MTVKTVKTKSKEQEATVEFDFGDSLGEAVELFGEDTIFKAYISAATIGLQGYVRSLLLSEKNSQPEIEEAVAAWNPAMRKERVAADPVQKLITAAGKMTPEDRQAMLEKIAAALNV